MLSHLVHHRGQLSVYLRLTDTPNLNPEVADVLWNGASVTALAESRRTAASVMSVARSQALSLQRVTEALVPGYTNRENQRHGDLVWWRSWRDAGDLGGEGLAGPSSVAALQAEASDASHEVELGWPDVPMGTAKDRRSGAARL